MEYSDKIQMARDLFRIGAVKFGSFRLRLHKKESNAPLSPFYIDLRILQSYPPIIKKAANILIRKMEEDNLRPDIISGLPDSAVAIASLVMAKTEIPMITLRQHKKDYGIASSILGVFRPGDEVLLIDDLVTRADSKLETIALLENAGLQVKDILVLINREQGGKKQLGEKGYQLHAVFGARELFVLYYNEGIIGSDEYGKIINYLQLFNS